MSYLQMERQSAKRENDTVCHLREEKCFRWLFVRFFMVMWMAVFASLFVSAQSPGFDIPTSHPRLWWNTDRISLAKTWYASNSFTPQNDDLIGWAMRYVLTGNATDARKAIDQLMTLQLPAGQVTTTAIGCDQCRYYGESAAVVYDWCYDQMTAGERSTLIARWTTYWKNVNQQEWGGVGMEGNNYYWGNLRNSVEWGIATYHENPDAQLLLNHGLSTRWSQSFKPYANSIDGQGKGGALGEGPEYGSTLISYPIIPFVSMQLMGRDIYSESNFFKEALINNIYSTSPAPIKKGSTSAYGFFSYNETDIDDLLHDRTYFGDFMLTMANYWRDKNLGKFARQWVSTTNPTISRLVRSVNSPGSSLSFDQLPYDYYAAGLGLLSARKNWSNDALAFQGIFKDAKAVGHAHLDYGSFQLFRKGNWVTRETFGYYDFIEGVNGDEVEVTDPEAHNSLFVGVPGDMKSLVGYWQTASPSVTRLESETDYLYASVDLSDCFQSESKPEYFKNPYVSKVVREFFFIRPLEALIVFDRILASNEEIPAENVVKMAIVHFENSPQIADANHVSMNQDNQVVKLATLVPANPHYTIVDEGGDKGQYRLQITTSGVAQSYFINLIHAQDIDDSNTTASVSETTTSFEINLSHPTRGVAKLILEKGATSTGGKIAVSASQVAGQLTDLTTEVATSVVTDDGVQWQAYDDNITGVEETGGPQIIVWPNPTNSTIAVEIPSATAQMPPVISLTTGTGIELSCNYSVEARESHDGITVICDLTALPPGLYTMKIRTGSSLITRKIIKTK